MISTTHSADNSRRTRVDCYSQQRRSSWQARLRPNSSQAFWQGRRWDETPEQRRVSSRLSKCRQLVRQSVVIGDKGSERWKRFRSQFSHANKRGSGYEVCRARSGTHPHRRTGRHGHSAASCLPARGQRLWLALRANCYLFSGKKNIAVITTPSWIYNSRIRLIRQIVQYPNLQTMKNDTSMNLARAWQKKYIQEFCERGVSESLITGDRITFSKRREK